MKKSIVLSTVALFFAGNTMAQTVKKPQATTSSPLVVTATGKIIGRFIPFSNTNNSGLYAALVDTPDGPVAFQLNSFLQWTNRTTNVYFATANCTGEAYLIDNSINFGSPLTRMAGAVTRVSGQWVGYYATGTPQQVVFQSSTNENSCNAYGGSGLLSPAKSIPLESPPFYVQ